MEEEGEKKGSCFETLNFSQKKVAWCISFDLLTFSFSARPLSLATAVKLLFPDQIRWYRLRLRLQVGCGPPRRSAAPAKTER